MVCFVDRFKEAIETNEALKQTNKAFEDLSKHDAIVSTMKPLEDLSNHEAFVSTNKAFNNAWGEISK
jgi:hypothetical protein